MSTLKGSLSNIHSDADIIELYGVLSDDDNASMQGLLSNTFLRGLSAYQEALLNGFEGTREEWIRSLKGKEILLQENNNTIEWKYEGDIEWKYLISLEATRDYSKLVNKPTLNNEPLDGEIVGAVRDTVGYYLDENFVPGEMCLSNTELEDLLG